jgi:hypothetical protein
MYLVDFLVRQLLDLSESDPETAAVKTYRSPPPSYHHIRGKNANVGNNLMGSFVCMVSSEETFGNVNELRAMMGMAES